MLASETGRNWLAFITIFLVTAGIYSNSLNIPWYLDDYFNIVNNPAIRDLTTAFSASTDGSTFRAIAFVTFAFNYYFSGLDVTSYHIVNIALHAFTGLFVFLLLKRVFEGNIVYSLMGTLFFISHPLQTQTVNYIVQRMTGMSGFFLFLALYLFVRAKESLTQGHRFSSYNHLGYYSAFFVSAVLAVLTKENAAILPVLCLLFEYFFLKSEKEGWLNKLLYVVPACLAPIVLGFQIVIVPLLTGGGVVSVIAPEDLLNSEQSSPLYYFVTQWSVLWIYIRLLLLPMGQVLDYGYPVTEQLLTMQNVAAGLGLVALMYVAFRVRKKYPLGTFGVLWFFLALSIESSIIPLDTVFEHRLYVPMFGCVVILTDVIRRICRDNKRFVVASCALLILYSATTYQRNALWAEPIAFYEHDVEYGYGSYRSSIDLADAYYNKGELDKARKIYEQISDSIEKRSVENIQPKMLLNLAVSYGRFEDYLKAEKLLRLALTKADAYELYYNLGIALYLQGRFVEAYQEFARVYQINPEYVDNLYYYILLSNQYNNAEVKPLMDKMRQIHPEYAKRLTIELRNR